MLFIKNSITIVNKCFIMLQLACPAHTVTSKTISAYFQNDTIITNRVILCDLYKLFIHYYAPATEEDDAWIWMVGIGILVYVYSINRISLNLFRICFPSYHIIYILITFINMRNTMFRWTAAPDATIIVYEKQRTKNFGFQNYIIRANRVLHIKVCFVVVVVPILISLFNSKSVEKT